MIHATGLDAGSVSVKLVVLDGSGNVAASEYRRHQGRPLETALDMLGRALERFGPLHLAATGSTGKHLAKRLGVAHVNELLAHAASTRAMFPEVRSIIEMGGEDSKLIQMDGDAIKDFALNSVCAAGTGSFLDQQAERMRLTIEEFADLALTSRNPPRIAGRCSVFAKSDMIHLQQIATPMEDIVAGLCFAVARNFQGSIVRNRVLEPQVAFMGGVALNKGMARAFKEVLALDGLIVPEPPTIMGAAGAALKARAEGLLTEVTAAALERAARSEAKSGQHGLGVRKPLVREGDAFTERHLNRDDSVVSDLPQRAVNGKIPAFLGVDIGSISTCLALVDDRGELLAKRYLRTASRPIEAVLQGLREIGGEAGGYVDIKGVGTTGSGRYMIADFINADVVKNEITAHARGAAHIDPGVDTIFEIGGQDSKYVRLKDGIIVDFEMNKACAAGTGSFLEEQAEKLSVQVKDEFASLALASGEPCSLGERCTVFMENSLQASLQRGAGKGDLLAGLAYSIVENYINRVVCGRSIGDNVFFQGGTAFNKAVVAAFEKFLDRRVTVPPHHDNTGAIGMALLAKDHVEEKGIARSAFKGFDLADRSYTVSSFECKGCENRCEINRVRIEGEQGKLFYGGRCEKYDIRQKVDHGLEDLFGFREAALERTHKERAESFAASGGQARRGVIGVPRVFFFQEYLPFFTTLLWELGFEVRVSPRTNRQVAGLGVKAVLADTCYPIKASLGHVRHLLDQGMETIFLPSFVNMAQPGDPYPTGYACPLTQSFPYQARAAFLDADILAPVIKFKRGPAYMRKRLRESLSRFGVGQGELNRALAKAESAQQEFYATIRAKGREVLNTLESQTSERTLVIMGRTYNAFDMGMNLEIPKKLATLNVRSLPMDFLPQVGIHEDWPEMYWRSGQKLLQAARFVRTHDKLNGLFIGSFSCGPDSFIQRYFDAEMGGKPYLHVEIDEHSADAGVITRCEAFLDSLEMQERLERGQESRARAQTMVHDARVVASKRKRLVHIPSMCDHAHALEAAFKVCGVDADVLPPCDEEAITLGRKHVSGKECYPFAVTTGDMLRRCLAPDFDPEREAFFMPSGTGPCRFGQYNLLQRLILDKAGFADVPIYSPVQDVEMFAELGMVGSEFPRRSWEGVVAIDLLTRALHETRPYERDPGAADALYAEHLAAVRAALLVPRNGKSPTSALMGAMENARDDFAHLERANNGSKPLVGIVGEIFVRSNRFSNENLVRKVEELGGQAWLAPIDEWMYYVNWTSLKNARADRKWKKLLQVWIKNRVMTRIGHDLEHLFDGSLASIHDPDTEAVLANASPYLHDTFRGEAVLSVGKTIDMVRRGAVGIINAMPFGCMPGTVVTSILRGMSAQYGFPAISIPFDGTDTSTTRLQLEAFMEQAVGRMKEMERGEVRVP